MGLSVLSFNDVSKRCNRSRVIRRGPNGQWWCHAFACSRAPADRGGARTSFFEPTEPSDHDPIRSPGESRVHLIDKVRGGQAYLGRCLPTGMRIALSSSTTPGEVRFPATSSRLLAFDPRKAPGARSSYRRVRASLGRAADDRACRGVRSSIVSATQFFKAKPPCVRTAPSSGASLRGHYYFQTFSRADSCQSRSCSCSSSWKRGEALGAPAAYRERYFIPGELKHPVATWRSSARSEGTLGPEGSCLPTLDGLSVERGVLVT